MAEYSIGKMNGAPDADIAVFTEALRLPLEERDRFLSEACIGDDVFRSRVEALLQAHGQAGDFLGRPAADRPVKAVQAPPGEKPGDRIGHYRLLQQIGEGGCGVVYMAEQEAPVRRRVALKIIKPGMDTKSVIARFEAERQALAMMDHPNIAKVFDAGATESGRPYFVMELVRGVKITEYCDQHSLTTEERLKLFVQVCQAVQHAHQKGIIHRDIKPSNILVTQSLKGVATPVVIDFGVAKATTGQPLTDKTVFTAFEMLIGTPAYMSPEQAALSSAEVDTRTDIYSLGVLLYELLTGTTPLDTHELLKAGFDEVRRVIRDEEPVRPSTRLTTMTAADFVRVSKHHGAEGTKLIREMRGELDWIVMKALEKDRTRRYATANDLGMDVQRYLSEEAVLACPPSRVYQFRKLVSRHKLQFAALGIVMAALLAGLSVSTWSLAKEKRAHHETDLARIEANEQRTKALSDFARAREAMEFLKKMLAGVDPMVALGQDSTMLRGILDQTVKHMDLELTNQPDVRADLIMTIGPVYGELRELEKEEPLIRKALEFYRQSRADDKIADALTSLSFVHQQQRGKLDLAEQEAREALALGTNSQSTADMRQVRMETCLGWALALGSRPAEAEPILRKALATGERLAGKESGDLLDARAALAMALNLLGKFDEAEEIYRESITIGQKAYTPEHPFVANDMYRLAIVLANNHKFDQAETFERQCLAIRRKILGVEHPDYDLALMYLAIILRVQNKDAAATEAYTELLAIRRRRFGDRDDRVTKVVDRLVEVLVDSGNDAQFNELARDFPKAWFARSENLARRHQWSNALAAASTYLKKYPDDHQGYHLAAPLMVQTENRSAYEELCKRITTQFAGTDDRYVADRMAKDCLILARPGADLKVACEFAETAVTKGENDAQSLPFFQCCKALAEYRLGNWEGATNWANRAAAHSTPYAGAEAYAILAMAQFQLKDTDGARDALNKCTRVVATKMPKLTDEDVGASWRDLIIAYALQSEAKKLIDGDRSAASPPTLPQ